jgi:ABC-type transport system involved in multi-copper enzyme maturation permease subunit
LTSTTQAMMVIAAKEFMEHVRSKRILIIGGLFFGAFLLASILGIFLFMDEGVLRMESGEAIRAVLVFYFSIGLVGGFAFTSVLAIAMSADAVCGEWKDKTLFLLLSKPISREAMLAGKIIAAYVSVIVVFVFAALVSLVVMVIALGWPDGESWGAILGGLGLVLLGLMPFVAVGVLCSTLFRTPVGSFVVALGLWFLVFPLIGNIGVFIEMVRFGTIGEETISQVFALLSPSTLMREAGNIWAVELFFGFGGENALPDTPYVVLAMFAHTAIYLVLSFLIVRSRDYA